MKKIAKEDIWPSTLKITLKMTVIALFSSLALALKIAFAFLPNVEFVTFILMFSIVFFTITIGFGIINVYCTLNMVYFGIADWSIMYFIIFNLYGVIMLLCKQVIYWWWWMIIIICALMGYIFGSLYAIQTAVLYGPNVGLTYWIKGLVFDAIHGTGNAVICAILYPIIYKLMQVLSPNWPYLFNNKFVKYLQKIIAKKNELQILTDEKNKNEKIPVE